MLLKYPCITITRLIRIDNIDKLNYLLTRYLLITQRLKMTSALIFQIESFLIMSLMIYGVYVIKTTKNRKKHVTLMNTAMLWDVVLILQIELSRGAINKASQVMTNSMLLKIHLFFAISSVLLYLVMFVSGRKILAGDVSRIPKHKSAGLVTLVFRILTFVTSFYAVTPSA